jgi:hypothetical protein
MSKIPTMDEMAKQLAEKALDELYCGDKSLREWMRIIASEDAISRAEAKKKFDGLLPNIGLTSGCIQKMLDELPPIQPKAKVGKWIRVDKTKVKCSECDITHFIAQYPMGEIKYCPNCGAEMQEVEK